MAKILYKSENLPLRENKFILKGKYLKLEI